MSRETVDACLVALDRTDAHTVDLTGGAPELNPHFRYLVEECASRGVHVIDRCNLTVLLLPRSGDLPEFLAAHGVEVVCSLPHSRRRNTDAQRGDGTYVKSIEALRRLNRAGYGGGDPGRRLTLVTNPAGAVLTGSQRAMEREWKAALAREHGVFSESVLCAVGVELTAALAPRLRIYATAGDMIANTSLDEGDVVRVLRRTVDLLAQVPVPVQAPDQPVKVVPIGPSLT